MCMYMALKMLFCWKLKQVYFSEIISLYSAFLPNIKRSQYKTGMRFNQSILVVKQNNYTIKIASADIFYD